MNLIAKLIFAFAFFVSSSFADEIDDLKKKKHKRHKHKHLQKHK